MFKQAFGLAVKTFKISSFQLNLPCSLQLRRSVFQMARTSDGCRSQTHETRNKRVQLNCPPAHSCLLYLNQKTKRKKV